MLFDFLITDTKDLMDPKKLVKPESFPEERFKKALRFRRKEDRKLSYYSWILLENLLDRYSLSQDLIYIGKNGKILSPDFYLNLSHSDNKAMAVICSKPVGCDIQKCWDFNESVINKVFNKNDLENIKIEDKNITLTRLWSIKESFFKMTGDGISENLNKLTVDLEKEKIYLDGIKQNVFVLNGMLEDYSVAICIKN